VQTLEFFERARLAGDPVSAICGSLREKITARFYQCFGLCKAEQWNLHSKRDDRLFGRYVIDSLYPGSYNITVGAMICRSRCKSRFLRRDLYNQQLCDIGYNTSCNPHCFNSTEHCPPAQPRPAATLTQLDTHSVRAVMSYDPMRRMALMEQARRAMVFRSTRPCITWPISKTKQQQAQRFRKLWSLIN